jgi:2-methylcitrate dehydratase PrpD
MTKIESFKEVVQHIRDISAATLHEVANEILDAEGLSFLYYVPKN